MSARDLMMHGVCVHRVFDEPTRARKEEQMWRTIDGFPEYKVHGRGVQRVLGGFGALGNPSSFHAKGVRRLRRQCKRLVFRPLMREYVQLRFPRAFRGISLEMLFDRICIRCEEFGRPSAEAWHRDVYGAEKYGLRALPDSLPEGVQDIIFGGWINLSDEMQYFVCNIGTHTGVVSSEGFASLSDSQKARADQLLRAQANAHVGETLRFDAAGMLLVPPGHAVIFEQQLVHSVVSGRQPSKPQLRLFHGIRLTREAVPLFDIRAVAENGAVPRIPSGQIPPMYSANHYAFFNKPSTPQYARWASATFRDECLFRRAFAERSGHYFTPGSRDNSNRAANVGRYMPSLSEMGLWEEEFEYSEAEARALEPEPLFTESSRPAMESDDDEPLDERYERRSGQ